MDLPIVIKSWSKNFLGLVHIKYHVEDRLPDLDEFPYQNPDRFKHFLNVRVLWYQYNWTFRTQCPYEDLPFDEVAYQKAYRRKLCEKRIRQLKEQHGK